LVIQGADVVEHFSVSSSHGPGAMTNSAMSGKIERMDATNGQPGRWPLRKKVNPLTFMPG
jgi:hypothetical protein